MSKLLCIDDIPEGLALRSLMLEAKGYEVLTACDGPTGIAMARENAVDAVVLDYKMPGMMGDEVAATLKREHPDLPIVLLKGVEVGLPEVLLRMIDAYIGKGQPSTVLLTAIQQVVEQKKAKPCSRTAPKTKSKAG